MGVQKTDPAREGASGIILVADDAAAREEINDFLQVCNFRFKPLNILFAELVKLICYFNIR